MTDRPPFRYVDEDEFCLSARRLPDLTTGALLDTVSITVEGDSDPQSAHVPVGDLPRVLAGIAEAAGVAPAVAPTAPPAADCPCAVGVASAQCSPRGCAPAEPDEVAHFVGDDSDDPECIEDCPGCENAPPAADLRDRIAEALDNASHTHPCPATGDTYWTGCYHRDGTGPSCHTDRRTAAVLAALPTSGQCSCGGRFPLHHLHADTHEPASAAEPADRRARYTAAIREESSRVDDIAIAEAVIPVADEEIDAATKEQEQQILELLRQLGRADRENTRLLAEVERLRADRATLLRDAADRVDNEELPQDYVDMFDNGARWAARLLRRLADEAQQPETEAWPTETAWIGEVLEDDGAWMFLGASPDRSVAERRCGYVTRRHPEAQTRIVRKTTTYTVATQTDPPTHLPKGTNAEDCPACKGTNPPYPFLCPGPDAPVAAEAPCTCAAAGPEFAPAGHYADCPAAPAPTEEPQRPVVAYNDGKGNARVYCVRCPRPDDVVYPLDVTSVDDWDICPSCGRHCIDVARAAPAPTEEPTR